MKNKENSLLIKKPELCKEWNYEKNTDTNLNEITYASHKKVWWICKNGHEWESTIYNRYYGNPCPYCSGFSPCKENNLLVKNPELCKEWNYEKNIGLLPENVLSGSCKRVWWICEKGHEWKATINDRNKQNSKCEYCSGRKPSKDNNLLIKNPELCKEWNYEKNADLIPENFLPGSSKKVWWKCKNGHEWKTSIDKRNNGKTGCKICKKLVPTKDYNLLIKNPELCKEWNYDKNNSSPENFTPNSNKTVWWRCPKCSNEWQAAISCRNVNKYNCEICRLNKLIKENGVINRRPDLLKEFHPIKNGELKLESLTIGCHKKVWWVCEKGHEWPAQIKNRFNGDDCPFCGGRKPCKENNLLVKNPEIAKQWHPTKNGNLRPENVCTSSGKRVWWVCEKGHEWPATINHRNNYRNCPICNHKILIPENSLLAKNPEVCEEWHPTKNGNLKPEQFFPNSNKKVWWKCKNYGHEWPAKISKRFIGKGCPYCSGNLPCKENNLLVKNPEISKEWHPTKNGDLTPEKVCPNSNKKVWWLCKEGHEYTKVISTMNYGNGCCPICFKRNSKKAIDWLNKLGIPDDEEHREVFIKLDVNRYFADGLNPNEKIVFAFLGDYWHGNPNKFNPNNLNKKNNKTFGQLYEKTIEQFKNLFLLGYKIIYRWESDDSDKIFNGEM